MENCGNPKTTKRRKKTKCGRAACNFCQPQKWTSKEKIDCSFCDIVKTVSTCETAKFIDCQNCNFLEKIESQPKVETLWCHGCYALAAITSAPTLEELSCDNCQLLTECDVSIKVLKDFSCEDCPLLHLKANLFQKCKGSAGFSEIYNLPKKQKIVYPEELRPRNGVAKRFLNAFKNARYCYSYDFPSQVAAEVKLNSVLFSPPDGKCFLELVQKYHRK